MRKNLIVLVLILLWSCDVHNYQDKWVKIFGGVSHDGGTSITSCNDGGVVLTGSTGSTDGDFKGMNKGKEDVFLIKLDSSGNVQWKKLFGGTNSEGSNSIKSSEDGGVVLTGTTESNDGDFKGMNKGKQDVFVMKLDSRGNLQWNKTFGGSSGEMGMSITITSEGGCVVTGSTSSNDGDFKGMNKGKEDVFVMKLDSRGNLQWNKTFGGSSGEVGFSLIPTSDGGFVLTGVTESNDGDFKGMSKGGGDIFVVKLDSRGDIQWKKVFGGGSVEMGTSITSYLDGGYVITGSTVSNSGDFEEMNKGGGDIFVIKTDSRGDIQWKKVFGGSGVDVGGYFTDNPDGGFLLTGVCGSNDGDFNGMNKGQEDIFVIRLDSNGKRSTKW